MKVIAELARKEGLHHFRVLLLDAQAPEDLHFRGKGLNLGDFVEGIGGRQEDALSFCVKDVALLFCDIAVDDFGRRDTEREHGFDFSFACTVEACVPRDEISEQTWDGVALDGVEGRDPGEGLPPIINFLQSFLSVVDEEGVVVSVLVDHVVKGLLAVER